MQATLAVTALLMGLAGGPHCVAMCGAACGAIGRLDARPDWRGALLFQAGRLFGYSTFGALAAASVQGMGWVGTQVAALRPLWSLMHAAALVLGLVMLWQARQPAWLDAMGKRVWSAARGAAPHGMASAAGQGAVVLSLGAMWALMPCGLLYSALLVAALSGSVAGGAGVMAAFALGSGVTLASGPWLWRRLSRVRGGRGMVVSRDGALGVRLAGLALAVLSGWALWAGLFGNAAPWCLSP